MLINADTWATLPTFEWPAAEEESADILDAPNATDVTIGTALEVGEVSYRFKGVVSGRFTPAVGPKYGTFHVPLLTQVIGRGRGIRAAVEDWKKMFHAHFQHLHGLLDFQMSDEERTEWQALSSVVDVRAYERSNLLEFVQVGVIFRADRYPTIIKWSDGTEDRIKFDAVPAQLAGFRVGQWFEAVVRRSSDTHELHSVASVRAIPKLRQMTQSEEDEFWSSLPTTNELPEAGEEWATPA